MESTIFKKRKADEPTPAQERQTAYVVAATKSVDGKTAVALSAFEQDQIRIRKLQAELGVVPFLDLPEVQPLLETRKTLISGKRKIGLEIELYHLQSYLRGKDTIRVNNPDFKPEDKFAELKEREKKIKAELGIAIEQPAAQDTDTLPLEAQRALEMMAGNVTPPLKPEMRLVQLQDQLVVLEDALFAVEQKLAKLKSAATFRTMSAVQPAHQKISLELFRAAQAFAEVAERERLMRHVVPAAGFNTREDLLKPPAVSGAALALGEERDWHSPISVFRRDLQQLGVLP